MSSFNGISDLSASEESESGDEFNVDVGFIKISLTGPDYDLFKPIHQDGLYAQLLQNPNNLSSIFTAWLSRHRRSADEALIYLMQFFLDIAGYQSYQLKERYNFVADINVHDILDDFIDADNPLQKNVKCIINGRSSFSKSFLRLFSKFLNEFLAFIERNDILNTTMFLDYLVKFLNNMAASPIRVVRITFTVTVIKFYSAIKLLLRESDSFGILEQDELVDTLHACTESLFYTFQKNMRANFYDKRLKRMRELCLQELDYCLLLKFEGVVRRDVMNLLCMLLKSPESTVRFNALSNCIHLIETSHYKKVLGNRNYIELLINSIESRLFDVKESIQCLAIDFYIILSEQFLKRNRHVTFLTVEVEKFFIRMMFLFEQFEKVALKCGEYYAMYLGHLNDIEKLNNLILVMNSESKNRTSMFLKSIYHSLPINVQVVDNIIAVLSENANDETALDYLKLLFYVVKAIINSKSKLEVSLYESIFNAMDFLIVKFKNENKFQWIINVLNIVNLSHKKIDRFKQKITSILLLLDPIFFDTTDHIVLKGIAKLFSKLTESDVSHVTNDVVRALIEESVESFKAYSEKHVQTLNDEDLLRFQGCSIRLLQLLKYFKLLDFIHYDDFMYITFVDLPIRNEKISDILKIGLCCQSLYLQNAYKQCSPRNIVSEELMQEYDMFNDFSFNFLQRNGCVMIFNSICNLLLTFEDGVLRGEEKFAFLNNCFTNLCFQQIEQADKNERRKIFEKYFAILYYKCTNTDLFKNAFIRVSQLMLHDYKDLFDYEFKILLNKDWFRKTILWDIPNLDKII